MAVAAFIRAIASSSLAPAARSPFGLFLSKRLLHFSHTAERPFLGYRLLRPSPAFTRLSRLAAASRVGAIRSMVRRAGDSASSPLSSGPRSGSGFSDRPPTEMAPLFPGCDYEHWLIVMDKPGGEGATKQQMIDCYIQTLAKVVGSEEEAKRKSIMYLASGTLDLDVELMRRHLTSLKVFMLMTGLPGVLFVLPDSYVDAENKDYGAELFVDGEIVQRPPERQRRIDAATTHRNERDRPRYNDRTRYVRRRESQR